MKIDQYLELHNLTDAEFARRVKVTRAMVGRWRKGEKPSVENAVRIETVTDGEVMLRDSRPDLAAIFGKEEV